MRCSKYPCVHVGQSGDPDLSILTNSWIPSFEGMTLTLETTTAQITLVYYFKEPLKSVDEAASTRQNLAKRGSLCGINDRFELNFNAVIPTQVVFQRFLEVIC